MSGDRPSRRSEAFFGRRKGPALGQRKQRLIDALLPTLRLDPENAPPDSLRALFPKQVGDVWLEIGFGGGERLAREAEARPETGFIGIEPFINGMAKMLGEIEGRGLENVRLYDDDAARLLDWLPAGGIARADLLYPDPWPKRRHWKRRFVGMKNLDRLARILKPGGVLRFASDIDTYVNWTLLHAMRHPQFSWLARKADDWRRPWPDWHRTRYEAKAVREGRAPAYLEFRRRRAEDRGRGLV